MRKCSLLRWLRQCSFRRSLFSTHSIHRRDRLTVICSNMLAFDHPAFSSMIILHQTAMITPRFHLFPLFSIYYPKLCPTSCDFVLNTTAPGSHPSLFNYLSNMLHIMHRVLSDVSPPLTYLCENGRRSPKFGEFIMQTFFRLCTLNNGLQETILSSSVSIMPFPA